jgi:hypothetical protein
MLSSVLRSEQAVQVNVAVMRAFVSLRRMLSDNEALARKLAEKEERKRGTGKMPIPQREATACGFGIKDRVSWFPWPSPC